MGLDGFPREEQGTAFASTQTGKCLHSGWDGWNSQRCDKVVEVSCQVAENAYENVMETKMCFGKKMINRTQPPNWRVCFHQGKKLFHTNGLTFNTGYELLLSNAGQSLKTAETKTKQESARELPGPNSAIEWYLLYPLHLRPPTQRDKSSRKISIGAIKLTSRSL